MEKVTPFKSHFPKPRNQVYYIALYTWQIVSKTEPNMVTDVTDFNTFLKERKQKIFNFLLSLR